jgi:RNA polymerase II C-terminal domain phosphatase-like 3/4
MLLAPALEAAMSIVSTSDRATLMNKRKLILILDLDHTLLNSTKLNELSLAKQSKGFMRYTIGDLFWLDLGDLLLTVGYFKREQEKIRKRIDTNVAFT